MSARALPFRARRPRRHESHQVRQRQISNEPRCNHVHYHCSHRHCHRIKTTHRQSTGCCCCCCCCCCTGSQETYPCSCWCGGCQEIRTSNRIRDDAQRCCTGRGQEKVTHPTVCAAVVGQCAGGKQDVKAPWSAIEWFPLRYPCSSLPPVLSPLLFFFCVACWSFFFF